MPAEQQGPDSLREYLTGASSDGGAQASPLLCFGNYRSSTEALSYGIVISNALANISVDYAAGEDAPGAGTLTCLSASTVCWQDSAGSAGPACSLPSNGSTGIAQDGTNASSYVRVTRTSSSSISGGPATITLSVLLDNFFGFDDVTSALATSGESEYRASIVKNVNSSNVLSFKRWIGQLGTRQVSDVAQLGSSGAGTITTSGSFSTWPTSGWCQIQNSGGSLKEVVYYTANSGTSLTVPSAGRGLLGTGATAGAGTDYLYAVPGVAIALDTNGVQAAGSAIATIANANTAPAGVTWNLGLGSSTGLNIGTLTPGQQIGIWIWRQIPPGAIAVPSATIQFNNSFDA